MPAPKPPSPADLIAYTKATGKLYPSVHDDEHYYRITGQRVPWYKPPTVKATKPATPGQKVEYIEDTRKLRKLEKPTEAEIAAEQRTVETDFYEGVNKLDDAKAEYDDTQKKKELKRVGEKPLEATLRQSKRREELEDSRLTEAGRNERDRIQGSIGTDTETGEKFPQRWKPTLDAYQPKAVLAVIDPNIVALDDSLRYNKNAQSLGYSSMNKFYGDRNLSVTYISELNKRLKGAMAKLKLDPEMMFGGNPELGVQGQPVINFQMTKLRDDIEAELANDPRFKGLNYITARKFIDASEKE